ncbi:site-specific integrase [Corallococcus aberystwythensis]|uniref:Site-specific integrase n=1 Tax=Corallococcus aberystwythensis TaxID=2316722 RepID=A0A3A8RD84_9BACT|nr:site-specific integrase [Corallococcus aberystwythensis]RKH73384.1 site-specific integrase [Corallococcus aberystwythensis]
MEAHEGDSPGALPSLVREHLAGYWRDALDILAGTGWHVSELQRFAEDGREEPYPRHGDAEGVAGVLVCPSYKNGEELRTGASTEEVDAARRLRERGSLSIGKFGLAVRAACRAAGIPEVSPGRFRHLVATWAINQGAEPATVAAFLNHKSPRTTMRFYATHAIPKKIPTLR